MRGTLPMDVTNQRILVSLLVLVAWLAINVMTSPLAAGFHGSLLAYFDQRIEPPLVVSVLFLFGAVWLFGWNDAGLNSPFAARSLLPLWLPLALVTTTIAGVLIIGTPPGRAMVFMLGNTLLVGVSEELMFRGILFEALRSKFPIWPAILITSLLFAAMHLLNARGIGFTAAAVQSCEAFCTGMLLMAIRIRTRSLDPAILFHCAWDFGIALLLASPKFRTVGRINLGGDAVLIEVIFGLATLSYALLLLRNVARAERT